MCEGAVVHAGYREQNRNLTNYCRNAAVNLLRLLRFTIVPLVFWASIASADLVSPYGGETAPSFAEIVVEPDHVRVILEIDLSEYPFYVGPEDDAGASMAERTGQTFSIHADGILLAQKITAVGIRPRTKRQAASASIAPPRPRSEDVVFVELEFAFEGRPDAFTFTPPLDKNGSPLSSLGLLVEHRGVPVTDYRYLSGPEVLRPDWSDPWFSQFENPNLTRHHRSPMMSFLSIEPREVRHEIIVRLHDLETWANLGLEQTSKLTAEQIEIILHKTSKFFANKNPVTIDGKAARPTSVRASQIAIGAEGLRVVDATSETDRGTALLGVILSYPQRQLAKSVEMEWELFPKGVDIVPVSMVDPAGSSPAQAKRAAQVVTWTNPMARWHEPATKKVEVDIGSTIDLPIVSIALGLAGVIAAIVALKTCGAMRGVAGISGGVALTAAIIALPTTHAVGFPNTGPPDKIAARSIMSGMLDNLSAAMLEMEPEQFVASLEPFVSDHQRLEVASELRRGLSVILPSEALANTDEIVDLLIEDVSPGESRNDSRILSSWTSSVSGGHWGHMHRRQVTFRGLFDLTRAGTNWYFTGVTILSSKVEE